MSIVLPDPRLEMPELLIPGRKPTGAVQIDESHYLVKDNFSFLFGGVDMTTKTWPVLSGGAHLDHGDFSTEGTSTGVITFSRNMSPATLPFVISIKFKISVSGVRQRIFFSSKGTYCGVAIGTDGSNKLEITIGELGTASGSRRSFASTTAISAGWHTATVRVESLTTCTLILNGTHTTYSTSGSGLNYTPGSGVAEIGRLYSGSTSYYEDTKVERVYIHTGYLPDAALISLDRNPYQFLIPA